MVSCPNATHLAPAVDRGDERNADGMQNRGASDKPSRLESMAIAVKGDPDAPEQRLGAVAVCKELRISGREGGGLLSTAEEKNSDVITAYGRKAIERYCGRTRRVRACRQEIHGVADGKL